MKKNKSIANKLNIPAPNVYVCTACGGDATIAWHNSTKKNKKFFGIVLKPSERLCLSCGKKRGIIFF